MTRKHPTYTSPQGKFSYGYVREKDLMQPHWVAHDLTADTYKAFDTKAECLAWIKDHERYERHGNRKVKP